MKNSWPIGLVVFFVLFIGSLVFILLKSREYDNSLVVDDYYNQDIKYQQHYDKLKNSESMKDKVNYSIDSQKQTLNIHFPEGENKHGTIQMYNPLSKTLDKSFEFNIQTDTIFEIPLVGLKMGKWKLKMDWEQDNIPYFIERDLVL